VYKVAKEVFYEYINEKGIPEPTEKSELAQVLKKFYVSINAKKFYDSINAMTVGHAIVSSSNFILLTLLFTLYENTTTRLDCFKLNSTIDDSLINDFGGESQSTCGLNQRHHGYAGGKTN
jgi:hypothetical protein